MLTKRFYILFFLICIIIIAACKEKRTDQSIHKKENSPNIIYILADDLGYGDIKSLNPESKISTPNMDQLTENGVHFTDAHSNSAVCTPTRYGILTGRYAWRTRLKNGVLWGYSTSIIESERTTVASLMKKQGYQTACIGKWHLGLDWAKKDESKEIPDIRWNTEIQRGHEDNVDYTKKVGGGPDDHGFKYSYIIPASLDMSPYMYIENGHVVEQPVDYTKGKNQEIDGRGVFWRSGKLSPDFDFNQVLPTFIDKAISYIQSQVKGEAPFFLYLALPAPHTPWLPTMDYQGNSQAGAYGDFVTMVDDMIGKVLQQVKASGIEENTMIIVTSDNGSDWRPSDIEKSGHKANYIFKGRKADIYEAGHRIPYIAQWKGVIPAGHSSDQLMCTTDLLATLAGLLNQPLSNNEGEDSFNMWPAYTTFLDKQIRSSLINHSLEGYFAIRQDKWKYTPHLGSGGFSVPIIIEPEEGGVLGTLYDMENDPQEQNNLYHKYPEKVKALEELLEQQKLQGNTRERTLDIEAYIR
jgi:arylsulfatase A-like enzyme